MSAALAGALARFEGWMLGEALPRWRSTGHDGPGRGFVEQLTPAGVPAALPHTRLRVQARQIYVFSHAALLGWKAGLPQAEDAFAFIQRHGRTGDGGWARSLGRAGGVLDATADLYDLAFVLFACAWHARATRREEPLALARETIGFITARMRVPGGPGFLAALPGPAAPLQQNPHMHLLEAALALHETAPHPAFAGLAGELLALFRAHLFSPASGTLAEEFDARWQRRRGAEGLAVVEPGHQFEWCWLLHQARRLLGTDLTAEARALHNFATTHGTAPDGAVWDQVAEDGTVRDRSTRLWPQTEAIKSHLAIAEAAGPPADTAVAGLVELLLARFLRGPISGTWQDHLDPTGQPKGERIPASSLYHLFLAYAELRRLAGA